MVTPLTQSLDKIFQLKNHPRAAKPPNTKKPAPLILSMICF
jgi:hypothetical protein